MTLGEKIEKVKVFPTRFHDAAFAVGAGLIVGASACILFFCMFLDSEPQVMKGLLWLLLLSATLSFSAGMIVVALSEILRLLEIIEKKSRTDTRRNAAKRSSDDE